MHSTLFPFTVWKDGTNATTQVRPPGSHRMSEAVAVVDVVAQVVLYPPALAALWICVSSVALWGPPELNVISLLKLKRTVGEMETYDV